MAITMLCTVYSCMKRGEVRPCLCLAFINLVPLIGACSGFKVLSKSCDHQYTHIMLFRVLLTHRVENTLVGLKAVTEEVGVLTSYRPTRIPQTR